MINIALNLFLGVLSGVLTSAFIYGSALFLRRVVIPWYQNLVYEGVRIDGVWEMSCPDMAQMAQMELKQRASVLNGSLTFVLREGEGFRDVERLRTSQVTGRIVDRFITLDYKHTDKSRLGVGGLLFEVIGDGRQLDGVISLYSIRTNRVMSSKVLAVRPGLDGLQRDFEVRWLLDQEDELQEDLELVQAKIASLLGEDEPENAAELKEPTSDAAPPIASKPDGIPPVSAPVSAPLKALPESTEKVTTKRR